LLQVSVETALEILEVADSGIDVLFGIVQILRAEPMAGARHQLHQTLSAHRRASSGMKSRFGLHYSGDECRIDIVLLRLRVNEVAERHSEREEILADRLIDTSHFSVK